MSAIGRLKLRAGLDEQVLSTLLFRGWSTIAGAVSLVLAPIWLSPTQQGYYYTFGSVLALQIFFELGLNQIVLQLASHEVAHLTMTTTGGFEGEAAHVGRLGSLARMLGRWYTVAAVLFALVGGAAGAVFFSRKGVLPTDAWLGVWLLLVGATSMNLWLSPRLALLEGCGRIGQVARLRLKQSLMGYVLLWLSLVCGAGLWSALSIPLTGAACTWLWLKLNGQSVRWLALRAPDPDNRLVWSVDVLPLQWRIAVSWISGFFIFNLFTPLVFARQGAIEAGRLGIALTIFGAASTIGMSWINAKAPALTALIARNERATLNTLFRGVAFRSTAVTALICAGVVAGACVLTWLGLPAMKRLASPQVLLILAAVTTVNASVFCMATYMRAHREEPMLWQSVVTAALTGIAAFLGSRTSVPSMMALYLCVALFVSLPWTVVLFSRYYRRA